MMVYEWLQEALEDVYDEVKVTRNVSGPGLKRFDMVAEFTAFNAVGDVVAINIVCEVDGAQHFAEVPFFKNNNTPKNDVIKEVWAVEQGMHMIRLIQEEAWKDRDDPNAFFKQYILSVVASIAEGAHEPCVHLMPRKEYYDAQSFYVTAHAAAEKTAPVAPRFDV